MIVVVLPAYNEAVALPRLLARLRDVAPQLPHPVHVVVVDDGSSDGTPDAVARVLGGPPVRVASHGVNRGLHAALDTGLRAALDACRGDGWVVTMDADDTHPPELIPRMIACAGEGASVVIASRFQPGAESHGLSWDRRLFSIVVSWLFRVAWNIRGVRDYTCGYRAYRVEVLRQAYAAWGEAFVSEPSFACMPDVLWKVSRLDASMAEVPLVLHYDRKPGASKMNVSRTIRRTLALILRRRREGTPKPR
ncbi:MAG: glycosyltransferase family 2 protein [Acidobacteriota bacterium]